MKQFFINLSDSFKAGDNGYSTRKIFGLLGLLVAAHVTFKYCDAKVLDAVISTWLLFVATCAGLVTLEAIMKLRGGVVDKPKDEQK